MSVSDLLLPDHVLYDLEREEQVDTHIGAAHAVDREIRMRWPDCSLVWGLENATAPGIFPARWHVRRTARDQGHMDQYFPWVGDDGEYREPDMGIITMLNEGNLWNRDVGKELRRKREERARRVAKAKQALAGERIDTFATHAKALLNPGVSFSTARPWTNRVNKLPAE